MKRHSKYAVLHHLSILTAIDVAAFLADLSQFFVWTSISGAGTTDAADAAALPVSSAYLYLVWTIWVLRLLIWTHTVMTLSRLTGLCKSFGKAQFWYFIRILFLLPEVLLPALLTYRYPDTTSAAGTDPHLLYLFTAMLLFLFLDMLFGEALLLPLGSRTVLSAAAELMETFGEDTQAERNRRCGNRLLLSSLAFLGLVLLLLFLAAGVLVSTRVFSVTPGGTAEAVLGLLALAAAVLCLPVGAAALLFRCYAAVCIRKTYRTIEELSQ